MRQKKAKKLRRIAAALKQKEGFEFYKKLKRAKSVIALRASLPKDQPIYPSKRHNGESMDAYRKRRAKVNKAKRERRKCQL